MAMRVLDLLDGSAGTRMVRSAMRRTRPPVCPVRAMVVAPASRASSTAVTTFGELPLALPRRRHRRAV